MALEEQAGLPPCHRPPHSFRPSRLRVGQWSVLQKGSALVALEQMPRDDQLLDFTGAFVNLGDAGITVVPLGWHLCHIAHATQDLNGLRWKAGAGSATQKDQRGEGQRARTLLSHLRAPRRYGVHAPGILTWWLMAVAASDAASLAIAAS